MSSVLHWSWIRWLAAACAVWLSVRVEGAVPLEPRLTATLTAITNYYSVTGATRGDLIRSKAAARPWKKNLAFDGLTHSDISWSFKCRERDGLYALAAVHTTTKVTVKLPLWLPPPDADPDLIARWRRFEAALGTHELGHVSLARLATANLHRELAVVKPQPSVRELTAVVEAVGRRVLDEFRRKEMQYDEETAHGVKQGARFR